MAERPDLRTVTLALEGYRNKGAAGAEKSLLDTFGQVLAYGREMEEALEEISKGGGGWSLANRARKALGKEPVA